MYDAVQSKVRRRGLRILTIALCAARSRIIVTVATLASTSAFPLGIPMGMRIPAVCRSSGVQVRLHAYNEGIEPLNVDAIVYVACMKLADDA